MKLVKLTTTKGDEVYVNPDAVNHVGTDSTGATMVVMRGDDPYAWNVEGSPFEVARMIDGGSLTSADHGDAAVPYVSAGVPVRPVRPEDGIIPPGFEPVQGEEAQGMCKRPGLPDVVHQRCRITRTAPS